MNEKEIALGIILGSIVITLLSFVGKTDLRFLVASSLFVAIITVFCWVILFLNISSCIPFTFELCSQAQHAGGFSITTSWLLFLLIYYRVTNLKKPIEVKNETNLINTTDVTSDV